MFDLNKVVRPNVLKMSAYSSARSEFSGVASVWLDANENPFTKEWNRYPDPLQLDLKKQIAPLKKIEANQIFIGNGSDEAIDLLVRGFCRPQQDYILQCSPTYGVYQVSAAIQDIEVKDIPLTEDFQLNLPAVLEEVKEPNCKVTFICSPNNPTGNCIAADDIKKVLSVASGLVVVDEAYIDFAQEADSFSNWLNKYPNLVVLQTLSKAWGLAAVRFGMAFAPSPIIDILNKIKPPYNIPGPSQKVIAEALKNKALVKTEIASIIAERAFIVDALKQLKRVEVVYPTDANFILVKLKDPRDTYNALANQGIIVRDRSKVVNGCLRISVGTRKENELLIAALQAIDE